MFLVECPGHGRRVLVPETRIRGLRNLPEGILVELECWCGTRVAVRTGRHAAARPHRRVEPAADASEPRVHAAGWGRGATAQGSNL